ncbi:flagellar filament capping protein FliD [Desulfobotulus alkaliphilus]|nr:flagellar filament capping protein FliD [Desulfobotulus alkaliphilus]
MGSNLNLGNMLDDLKEIDKKPIKRQEENRTKLQAQARTIDSLNAQLMGVRSAAFSLSLGSSYLGRSVSSGTPDVVTARAQTSSGIATGNHNIEVNRLARRSAWQSQGFESASSTAYPALSTGFSSPSDTALQESVSFTIGFGEDTPINISLNAGASLKDVADAINSAEDNKNANGKPLIRASIAQEEHGTYIRLHAAEPDETQNQQILLTEGTPDAIKSFVQPDLTFRYKVGLENDPVYVSLQPGSTYQQMVDTINSKGEAYGMQAAIIYEGNTENPYRMTLTSTDTGEANRIQIEGLMNANGEHLLEEMQGKDGESLNASLTVNGISYQRNRNEDISDVIPGLSLDLTGEGRSAVSIRPDHEDLKDDILNFINGIIEFSDTVRRHTTREPEEEDQGLLNDVGSVRNINQQLISMLSQTSDDSGDTISSLFDMGLSIDRTGKISFDEAKLDKVLSEDPDGVKKFFLGNTEDEDAKGFAAKTSERLTQMTSDTGVFTLEKNSMEDRIKRLDTSIENSKARLDRKYEIMALQFIELDRAINALNNQADFMTSMFDSFNNAASNKKK